MGIGLPTAPRREGTAYSVVFLLAKRSNGPEETSVEASLPELVEQAHGVRVDNGVWLYLERWVLSWIHHRRHVTWSLSSETSTSWHRMPATVGSAAKSSFSTCGCHKSSCAGPRQGLGSRNEYRQDRLSGTREQNVGSVGAKFAAK